ncbi:AbrB/MazE/SpoVT family DNA-binding domain-containing protein [Candidatus Woesearchaeota archaeon]|nr:AbrB/MazE/SpoVT family DNA-binding domain-containing protein [Candidatus Woesearchaeota archaeon]
MKVKTVKMSEKGQIAIPLEIREAIGLKKGDELLLLQEGERVFIEKATSALKDEFEPLLKASEKTLKKLWDNKFDEVWNNV